MTYEFTYDWKAMLAVIAILVVATRILYLLIFRVAAFREVRELNRVADEKKMARPRYREGVKASNRAGLFTNLFFYAAVLPWFLSFDARPLWRHAVDVVAVLLVFDFLYYLTHRFVFHDGFLRKVHALHHQARTPTHMDGLFVHPLETAIGIVLFQGSIPIVALATGAPLSAYSMAVATLLFTQLNILNHDWVNLRGFPYSVLSYITGVHASHHIDMNHGNYATLSMIYDKLLGTYEPPTYRETA